MMMLNFESQLDINHHRSRSQKNLTMEAEPDEDKVENYKIMRHKYLHDEKQAKIEKAKKDRQE